MKIRATKKKEDNGNREKNTADGGELLVGNVGRCDIRNKQGEEYGKVNKSYCNWSKQISGNSF